MSLIAFCNNCDNSFRYSDCDVRTFSCFCGNGSGWFLDCPNCGSYFDVIPSWNVDSDVHRLSVEDYNKELIDLMENTI